MMKTYRNIAAVGVLTLAAVSVCSCRGRHADATPNGETVDVVIEEGVQAPPAGDTAAQAGVGVADTLSVEEAMK